MNQQHRKKIMAVLMLFCMLLTLLVSVHGAWEGSGHNPDEDHCPLCAVARTLEQMLQSVSRALVWSLIPVVGGLLFALWDAFFPAAWTPLAQKRRLNQ